MNRKQRRANEKSKDKQSKKPGGNGAANPAETGGMIQQEDGTVRLKVGSAPTEENKAKFAEAQTIYQNGEELDHLRAAVILGDIIKDQPDYYPAVELMGVCSLKMKMFEQAEAFFKAMGENVPFYSKAWRMLGLTYFQQDKYREALEAYDQAISIAPCPLDYLMAARSCSFIGEKDKGKEYGRLANEFEYERDEQVDRQSLYFYVESFLKIEDEEDPFFKELMKNEKTWIKKAQPHFRAHHYNVTAKAYNDMKNYDKAFEYNIKACEIFRESVVKHDQHKYLKDHTHMAEYFSPAHFKDHEDEGFDTDLPVFVLGMPRSGTTLLEQVMHAHPDVAGIGEDAYMAQLAQHGFNVPPSDDVKFPLFKTPRLVEEEMRSTYADFGKTIHENYAAKSNGAKRVVNKAINNYLLAGVIALSMPKAKLIHIERHPLDSCVSTFSKLFVRGSQPYSYDLKELGEAYAAHKDLMAYWYENCPSEILHVRYEDMVDDLETEARRIIDFLDLPWNDSCLEFYKAEKTVKTASKGQVFQPIFRSSLNKWKRYEKYLAPLVEGLGNHAPEDCRYIIEKYG